MKKYFWVARNTWEEVFTYRLDFIIWRVRTVIFILSLFFLWQAVIPQGTSLFGYDQKSMLTYILGTALVGAIVLSNRSYTIGENINSGDLSNFLIKPMNYFAYWFSKDIGDKLTNIIFSIAELSLIYLIFKPPVYIQQNINNIFFFVLAASLAVILYFWSPDYWAPRFIFWIVIEFFAGAYFPLDILPSLIYKIFELLPFTYLIYFPIKIYLGQLAFPEIVKGIFIMSVWIGILFFVVNFVWRKGLKAYTAQGR
jgi:ABC-2 type transport system permease protein